MGFYEEMLASGAIVETPEEIARKQRTMLPRTRRQSAGGTLATQPPAAAVPTPEDNIRRGIEMYSQEDDYSEAQKYARDRAMEGDSALLNAFAAQVAGKRFEPVAGMYLKRALAAREPMRVGNAMIAPDGSVLKDPGAARMREADKLIQLGQFEMGLNDRRAARESDSQLRMTLAQMRGTGSDSAADARNWRNEDKLRNDYEKITGDLRTELGATRKITEIINAYGGRPEAIPAIPQQSLVILLNKFLDPGSVVREGEFDRVVKAQGLEGRASNLVENLAKGKPLNVDAIKQINELAQLYQRAAEAKMRTVATQYATLARNRGLDETSVIMDNGLLSAPTPAAPNGQQIIVLPPLR